MIWINFTKIEPILYSFQSVINRNSSKVTALNFLTFVNSKLNEKNEIILSIIQYSRFNYN